MGDCGRQGGEGERGGGGGGGGGNAIIFKPQVLWQSLARYTETKEKAIEKLRKLPNLSHNKISINYGERRIK